MKATEKPRVLYLSYDGLTDPLGQSQILPYLTGLSSDYDITIVSFEKKNRFRKERKYIDKICAAGNIRWEPLTYHKSPPVLSTVFDLWRLDRKARKLHRKYNYQIVHCRSYITSLVGLRMKRRYGLKFIFDMRGFWADERVDGGLWNLNNPLYKMIYRFFKHMERKFLNQSDQVISLTENAKSEIQSWNISTPIAVIPCCVDTELFDPEKYSQEDKAKLRSELGLTPDNYTVLYLGSLGTWYMVDEMLDVFSSIRERNHAARLLLVTPDNYDFQNYRYADSLIVRSVPRDQVPLYMSIAHLGIFFIKPAYSKTASSPTKMGELLSMNIPIVCNSGWGDIALYARVLKGMVVLDDKQKDYTMTALLPGNNREWVVKNLSLAQGRELYKKIYVNLFRKGGL